MQLEVPCKNRNTQIKGLRLLLIAIFIYFKTLVFFNMLSRDHHFGQNITGSTIVCHETNHFTAHVDKNSDTV